MLLTRSRRRSCAGYAALAIITLTQIAGLTECAMSGCTPFIYNPGLSPAHRCVHACVYRVVARPLTTPDHVVKVSL